MLPFARVITPDWGSKAAISALGEFCLRRSVGEGCRSSTRDGTCRGDVVVRHEVVRQVEDIGESSGSISRYVRRVLPSLTKRVVDDDMHLLGVGPECAGECHGRSG